MSRTTLLLLPVLIFLIGCGRDGAPAAKRALESAHMAKDEAVAQDKEMAAAGAPPARGEARKPAEKPEPRKIIYSGQLELIVEDFDLAGDKLRHLVKENDGYIARAETQGTPGSPRRGNWTLRIPVANFDDFMTAAQRLGEMLRHKVDSEDITDRYYDIRAEVKNLEIREEALRALYKEKIAGTQLAALLEVDRELNNVRGQINVRKGQLQRWDKETEFASVVVTLQERKGYVPPVSTDFNTTVGRTFSGSIDALVSVGRFLVLAVVALAPWLGVLLVLAVPIWLGVRRGRRKTPANSP